MHYKKGFLKHLAKLIEKHLRRCLSLKSLKLEAHNFSQRRLWQVFSYQFCEIFRNNSFEEFCFYRGISPLLLLLYCLILSFYMLFSVSPFFWLKVNLCHFNWGGFDEFVLYVSHIYRKWCIVVVERASYCGPTNVVIKKLHSGSGLGIEMIFINEATILFKI